MTNQTHKPTRLERIEILAELMMAIGKFLIILPFFIFFCVLGYFVLASRLAGTPGLNQEPCE